MVTMELVREGGKNFRETAARLGSGLSLLLLLVVFGGESRAQDPSRWIGVEVIIKPGAEALPTLEPGAVVPFRRYRIERVEGDRFWVVAGASRGWVPSGDIVPFSEAVRFFTRAVRADPQAAWAYARRALVWYDKDELEIAIADYTEAIRLDPEDAVTFDNRGLARLEKKEYHQALADFNEAHRLDPKEGTFLDHRGLCRLARGEIPKAIADFSEAIRLSPRSASALDHRGFAHAKERRYDRAIADYEAALRIDSGDVWASNALAWLRATCPDPVYRDGKKALAFAEHTLKTVKQDDPYLLGTRAAAEAEAGNFAEAAAWQAKALGLFPDDDPDLAGHQARLALYQAKRPYREGLPRP